MQKGIGVKTMTTSASESSFSTRKNSKSMSNRRHKRKYVQFAASMLRWILALVSHAGDHTVLRTEKDS